MKFKIDGMNFAMTIFVVGAVMGASAIVIQCFQGHLVASLGIGGAFLFVCGFIGTIVKSSQY